MRISDWSSDVCSSDLQAVHVAALGADDGCRDIGDEKVDRPDLRPGDELPQAVLARSHHHLSHCASGKIATTANCTAAVIAMKCQESAVLTISMTCPQGMRPAKIGRAHVSTPITNA